jgi:hypothetical protein
VTSCLLPANMSLLCAQAVLLLCRCIADTGLLTARDASCSPVCFAALELEGVYGARVLPQASTPALHIFGTPLGSCPPGSAVKVPDGGSSGSGSSNPMSSTTAGLDSFAGELAGLRGTRSPCVIWLVQHLRGSTTDIACPSALPTASLDN